MSIPPALLIWRICNLPGDQLIELRTPTGNFEDFITIERAREMANKGTIEGIMRRSGIVRYVRKLTTSAMPTKPQMVSLEEIYKSHSGAIASTNMQTFRERLPEAVVAVRNGIRVVVSDGEMSGFCWTHCSGAGLERGNPGRSLQADLKR